MKNIYQSEDILKKAKTQVTDQEKRFDTRKTEKGLLLRIYKELLSSKLIQGKSPIEK